MRPGTLYRAALNDLTRSARLAITEGQRAYSLGRLPARAYLSAFYARRARERLQESRRLERMFRF
jgi:hypothetical protein